MNPPAHRPAAAALFLLLVLPWVAPLSSGPSRNAWPYLMSVACMGGLLLLRRHWRAQAVAWAWLAAALLSCAIAGVQYLGWAEHGAPWIAPIGPGEGSANLRQRNQFATFTAIGLIALCYLASATHKRWTAPQWAALVAAVALLAVGNAVTSSRTGALAWAAVLAAGLWIASRGGPRAMALLPALGLGLYLCACVVMPVALEWVQAQRGAASPCAGGPCNAIERLADTGNDSRIALWRNVLELIALRPWTGWGWGELDYAHYVTLFSSPRFSDKLDNAHNLPLQLAVELGLPAAGLICGALWVLLWRARPWRESQPWRQAAWLVLAVIGLHSLLEYPLWYGPFQIATVLCACGLYWHGRPGRPADGPTPQQPASEPAHSAHRQRAWAWDALAAAMLLAAAVVAFDYHRVSQIYLPAAQRHSAYRMQALAHAQASWFFQGHARFAQLALTPLSADNAAEQLRLAQWLLHHSPEPLVIERLLDAAALLGDAQTQAFHAARYQAAYPGDHARWLRRQSAGRAAASP
jgi:O-antigen ligase